MRQTRAARPRPIAHLLSLASLAISATAPSADVAVAELRAAADLVRREGGGHRLILLGELHGTREGPSLVADLVSAYSAHYTVLLGLQIPVSERARIDRYLRSAGSTADEALLRSAPFLKADGIQHDGRRNLDVIELIERVRRLRVAGRNVAILAFDDASGASAGSEARDKAMAARLRAAFLA